MPSHRVSFTKSSVFLCQVIGIPAFLLYQVIGIKQIIPELCKSIGCGSTDHLIPMTWHRTHLLSWSADPSRLALDVSASHFHFVWRYFFDLTGSREYGVFRQWMVRQ